MDETLAQLRTDAEAGDIDAQYRLACCFAGGTGIVKDETEAEQWMQRAAKGGHADARKMLGWEFGIPSPQLNWEGPAEWYWPMWWDLIKWCILLSLLLFPLLLRFFIYDIVPFFSF